MARTHRNLTAWSGVVFAALLLGGCTGEAPSPPPTPAPTTESASPTPTPKAVVVAPSRPAAMDDDGPAGAEAAAVYFLALDSYMQATGDTSIWEEMSHTECGFCAARIDQAQSLREKDLTWAGGDMTATVRHTYAQDQTTGLWPIDVSIEQDEAQITDTTGTLVDTIPSGHADKRIEVLAVEGQWKIVGMGVPPEQ